MMNDPLVLLLGTWADDLTPAGILLRIGLAEGLSGIIGWERARKRHSAGLRTFILITLGAAVVMMLDLGLEQNHQEHMFIMSAAVLVSIALISANSLVFTSRNQIRGLTTAVAMWACGVIGLAIGAGYYTIVLVSFTAFLVVLSVLNSAEVWLKNRSNYFEIHLELKDSHYLQDFITTIRKLELKVDDIEANPAYLNSGLSVYSVAISIRSEELKKYKTHEEIIEALRSLEYIYHIEEIN